MPAPNYGKCMPQRLRLGIYGSCVSRDMAHEHSSAKVLFYLARQSLISALTPPWAAADSYETGLSSAFQARMVRADLGSTALSVLGERAPEIDGLVVDLVDERMGLLPLQGGSFATNSQELKASGVRRVLPTVGDHIEFGSADHLRLWTESAERFVNELQALNLATRTIVLHTPFAARTQCGDPVPPFMGVSAASWNEAYEPYFKVLSRLGLQVARLPKELALSDDAHRWGPAPYHYVKSAYGWLMDEVCRRLRLDPISQRRSRPDEEPLIQLPLGSPIMPIQHAVPEGTARLRLRVGVPVRRWRLRISNFNERTLAASSTKVSISGLWITPNIEDGPAPEMTRLLPERTLPRGDESLVTPWFEIPIGDGRLWSFTFGWSVHGDGTPVFTRYPTKWWRSRYDGLEQLPATLGRSSPYLPFTWRLEVDRDPGTQVLVGWGDETLLETGQTSPLQSWGLRHHALARSASFPGTSMLMWQKFDRQWQRLSLNSSADRVFHSIGLHDLRGGASIEMMRLRFEESLVQVRRAFGTAVTAITLPLSTDLTDEQDEVRRAHNAWLLGNFDGDVAEIRNGDIVVLDRAQRLSGGTAATKETH